MLPKLNNIAEQNLIFAGLGLQLGILTKEQVIRAFTEWLFDKSKLLPEILLHQNALTLEQANVLRSAVDAHIQKEGGHERALASLHLVKDLESDLDHLGDNELHATLSGAVIHRKELGLNEQFARSHLFEVPDSSLPFELEGASSKSKDRFERQQFFDAGNLGELYFANDTELNRTVVTKYIKPERANEGLTQALFHLEGEVTGALEHPGIVPVYGLGKDTKGRLFYAMRYIRGRKLSRVIAEYHAISPAEYGKKKEALIGLLQNFQSACLALEYAHMKGVLHCDIKPDNIMIGDYGEVFVVDWGLVMIHGEAAKQNSGKDDPLATLEIGQIPPYRPSETASSGLHKIQGGSRRGVGGTPAYMAPEQLQATINDDISKIAPPSDIYALGGTLFHILTGKAPHLAKKNTKESMNDFNKRIMAGDFPRPSELKPEIQKPLEAIALKALCLKPEHRYTSARELAEDIKRWLADEPVKAYQEGVLDKSFRFSRKNRTAVGVAAVLLFCLAMGGSIFGLITKGFNERLQVSEKEAGLNALEADNQRVKAQANADFAIQEKIKAQESTKLAKLQQEKAEQLLYINKIQTTWSNASDTDFAYRSLGSIHFSQRGWEHNFIYTAITQDQVTFPVWYSYQILSVAFSSDGKIIIGSRGGETAWDKTLKVLDANTGQEILTLYGHTDGINSVASSPDGKKIVSGSSDKTLKVWDANTGQEILTLNGHTGKINSVAFSPDGKRIVSGSEDDTLKVWDANTGQEIRTLKGHKESVSSVAFSPDGKRIVSGSSDKTLKVWDITTGQEIRTLNGHTKEVSSVAYSPDGKRIVGGGEDGIKVWDAYTGQEILILNGNTGGVSSVAYSPDGKRIVNGSRDKTLKVWDATTGQKIRTLWGHTDGVSSVAFSPDGKRIVSGGDSGILKVWDVSNQQEIFSKENLIYVTNCIGYSPDGKKIACGGGTIKVWDPNTGQEILTLDGHTKGVSSFAFSPDGKRIVSGGSYDETLKVWDSVTGLEVLTIDRNIKEPGDPKGTSCLAYSLDGKKIFCGGYDETFKVWDATTGQEIPFSGRYEGQVSSLAFSLDGKKILVCGTGNNLKIWNSNNGQEILTLKHDSGGGGLRASFSPDGKRIVSWSFYDHTLKIWDANTGKEIITLNRLLGGANRVAFSPDGKKIVSDNSDNNLKIWDVNTGQELLTLIGHGDKVQGVAFSPDSKKIVSVGQELKVWDANTGQEIFPHKHHLGRLWCVAYSPDGKKIVGGSYDKTLKVWDAKTEQEILTLNGHLKEVTSVVFSPDGKWIVSGSRDKTLKVWDATTGQKIRTLNGHTKGVTGVAFSPDGKRIVSGSDDSTLKVWDANTGQEVRTLNGHKDRVNSVAFSPDGKRIVSGGEEIKIWCANTGQEIPFSGNKDRVNSVVFSPDGERIVGVGEDIKVWDANTGQEILTLSGHTGGVNGVAYSPDGKRIVGGGKAASKYGMPPPDKRYSPSRGMQDGLIM